MEQSTKAYEPGTVALATVRNVPETRVVRVDYPTTPAWMSVAPPHPYGCVWHADSDVTDVRPLVVLDPEGDAVARFLKYHGADDAERPSGACSASYGLADLIRAQTKPPRIPEPGLWGVVEAARREHDGSSALAVGKWIHVDALVCPWSHTSGNYTAEWSDLIDPVLIRGGLS